jgi:Tfp pilus assembly protein PilX
MSGPTARRAYVRAGPSTSRRATRDDAGTALLLVVMCLLVAMTLSTALLGAVMSEMRPTAYEAKAAGTVHAAEAGLQVATGQLRAATSAVSGVGTTGDVTQLPCFGSTTPLVGSVGGGTGLTTSLTYSVTVSYFSIDPSAQTTAWRTANALPCTSGLGPTGVPLYALIRSAATGLGGSGLPASFGNRSLELVYALRSTDSGTLGGLIHTDVAGGMPDLCWTAPSATPAAGQPLTLGTCVVDSPRQMFAYRTDYSLVLAGTQSASAPGTGGMCVSADGAGTGTHLTDQVTSRANDLTSHGTVTTGVSGPFSSGTATTFDGTSGWLGATKVEPYPGPDPFTVTVRFRTTVGGFAVQYNGATDQSSGRYDRHIYVDSLGRVNFGVWTSSAQVITSAGGYNDGNWHTATGSVGAAGERFSLDGTLVGTKPTVTASEAVQSYWHIGWGNGGGWPNVPTSGYWKGSLAHMAVWSSQLSDAQVATLAAQTTDATARSTILNLAPRSYWPLGTGTDYQPTFQPCDAGNHQKWSYNDGGKFEIVKPDKSALADRCLAGSSPTSNGTTLVMPATCSAAQVWVPDKTVGAGAAGEATQQLVNYDQYGRCLDVTFQNVNNPWLIAYPCKQDPSRAITWNQRFVWDGTGTRELQTTPADVAYCLTTPSSSGALVTTQACASDRSDQRWTINADTGNRTTSFTIVAANGLCLDLGTPQGSGSVTAWSSIVVNPCAGTFTQKWNAPPLTGAGGVVRQRETTTG